MEVMKSGEADELDLEEASKQTALEFEDVCSEELKDFGATHLDTGIVLNSELNNCVLKVFLVQSTLKFMNHDFSHCGLVRQN